MQTWQKRWLAAAVWLSFVAVGACSKSEKKNSQENNNTPRPSTLVIGGHVGAALRLASSANMIAAIPYKPDAQSWEIFEKMVEVDIDADGNFKVPFETTAADAYILALVDKTQGKSMDSIKGVIGMTSGKDSLAKLPTSDAVADLDLGTVSADGYDATTSKTVADNAAAIDERQEVLEEIAKTDNTIKHVVNVYANAHEDGTNWTSKPFIAFSGAL